MTFTGRVVPPTLVADADALSFGRVPVVCRVGLINTSDVPFTPLPALPADGRTFPVNTSVAGGARLHVARGLSPSQPRAKRQAA